MKSIGRFLLSCLVWVYGTHAFTFTGDPATWQFFGVDEYDVSVPSAFYERFGHAVAADGNVLVVGAPRALYDMDFTNLPTAQDPMTDGLNGTGTGKAFVYRYDAGLSGWVLEAELFPALADVTRQMNFGQAVGISGNVIAIGASSSSMGAYASGAVFIFRLVSGSWVQSQIIQASDPSASARFGQSVSLDQNLLAVGSTNSDFLGAVYVFHEFSGVFTQEAKVLASDRGNQTATYEYRPQFGYSVSIDSTDQLLLVGSPHYFQDADPPGPYDLVRCKARHADCVLKGAAYIFRREAIPSPVWIEDQRLSWRDTAYGYNSTESYPGEFRETPSFRFGHSVSLKGTLAAVGAPRMDARLHNPFEPPSSFPATGAPADYVGRVFVYEGSVGFSSSSWTASQVLQHKDFEDGIFAESNGFVEFPTFDRHFIRDYFGTAVAIGGPFTERFIAVGAPGNDDEALSSRRNNSGAVYVFAKNNPLVVPSVPEPWPQFGHWFGIASASAAGTWVELGDSVAATDEWFAAGKPLYNNSMGGVQIYM